MNASLLKRLALALIFSIAFLSSIDPLSIEGIAFGAATKQETQLQGVSLDTSATGGTLHINSGEQSFLDSVAKQTNALRSVIISLLLVVLISIFLLAGLWEFGRKSIVVEPVEVPKDLSEKGFSPHVVAQRICSEINNIQQEARIRSRRLDETFELGSSQVDFTVPSAGISYRNVIRYARRLFGKGDLRIRGEIIRGESFDLEADNLLARSPFLTIVLRTSSGRQIDTKRFRCKEADLADVLKEAALEVTSLADPLIAIRFLYWREYKQRQFPRTVRVVRFCGDERRVLVMRVLAGSPV